MSGQSARAGFEFQDLYLLRRMLQAASGALEEAWHIGAADAIKALEQLAARFGSEVALPLDAALEGPQTTSPAWDVFVEAGGQIEFAEVKSGTIEKLDRLMFWRRLRAELGRNASQALVPVLVVDPSQAGDISKWQELALRATEFSGTPPSSEPQGNVLDSADLLREALWWLCCPPSSGLIAQPVDLRISLATLTRFELHCHVREQLESDVRQHLELLFPGGLSETHQSLLQGWLGQRGASPQEERRQFTLRDLLAEVGVLEAATSLQAGVLSRWRSLWNDAPTGVRARTRFQLGGSGREIEPERTQPDAHAAIAVATEGTVVIGQGGAGKSTFIAQMARAAEEGGAVILHCGADDVTENEAEDLIGAAHFQAALLSLRAANRRLSLLVDALDEAVPSLRKRWAQLLVRVARLPNVQVLVGMREAVWRSDGDVRRLLGHFSQTHLHEWSEELVREVLSTTPYTDLPQRVVSLLRTPILLDLFWGTFVDANKPDHARVARLEARHELLAVFWSRRLIDSPRYAAVPDLAARLMATVGRAAGYIGVLPEDGLDQDALHALLAEGVMVREGRLRPVLRFRHPLLRDFAFGQWCLRGSGPAEVADRYRSIEGALQRRGALRAVLEALTCTDAETEYPHVSLLQLVASVAQRVPAALLHVAEFLGALEPQAGINPATWPAQTQRSLPVDFGRKLLAAARLEGNPEWANVLHGWPDSAPWLDDAFPDEVWRYCSWLAQGDGLKPTQKGPAVRAHAMHAARKFRALAEAQRFREVFLKNDRWLKMQAIISVVPLLPDGDTLAWIERELESVSWRTGPFILDYLINLAVVSTERTAQIYRRVVGLSEQGGWVLLDKTRWINRTMEYHALDRALASETGRDGLIAKHPVEFIPVAVELAEGLYRLTREDPESPVSRMAGQLEKTGLFDSTTSDGQARQSGVGDLIDDNPELGYWRRDISLDVTINQAARARRVSIARKRWRTAAAVPTSSVGLPAGCRTRPARWSSS